MKHTGVAYSFIQTAAPPLFPKTETPRFTPVLTVAARTSRACDAVSTVVHTVT